MSDTWHVAQIYVTWELLCEALHLPANTTLSKAFTAERGVRFVVKHGDIPESPIGKIPSLVPAFEVNEKTGEPCLVTWDSGGVMDNGNN